MAETGPVDRLVHRLDLDEGDRPGRWMGRAGNRALNNRGRIFGGHVIAQTMMAAGRTHAGAAIHSVQQAFLRAGRADTPITYDVTTIFEGRTYRSVTVGASQDGEVISHAQVGLTLGSDGGPDRWEPSDRKVVSVESSVNRHEAFGRPDADDQPVEFRFDPARDADDDPALEVLFRAAGSVPDDPLLHQAVLGFASDRAFLSVAWMPHREEFGAMRGATLTHNIWLHRPPDVNQWHTHIIDSPSIADGRGFLRGAIHDPTGRLVASVAQEGAMRPAPAS